MEGLLFSLAENLLSKLTTKVYQEISLAYGFRADLKELASTISTIKAVLSDAEVKKAQNNGVRIWLEQLQDVLYDAEDVFDELDCEALRRKFVSQWRTSKKVIYFFPTQFNNSIAFNFKMAHRIKGIRNRLDEIASRKQKFHLLENQAQCFSHTIREMTHSFIHESEASGIIGRDNDKKSIIQLLIQSNDDKELSIISLVGLGGLGKTTLAKLIYNDQRVNQYFEKKLWVCVSMDFDVQRLTREILSSATNSKTDKTLSMDQLQIELRKSLIGQRFLLVLDDVWNENANKWRDLQQILMMGATGSKVLVTTRMNSIADIMNSDEKHELRGISKEDSWSLFAKCVFDNDKKKEIPDDIKRIGEEILEKCKGVPLAIRSLGSLLYSKTSVREWEFVRDSEIWKLEDEEDGILPALKLSFNLMPSYLKPCFIYCALFPKDYVYSSDRLVRLWMAQGMLHSKNENEELEDIGERYFKELCSRSFFQDFQRDDISFDYNFKMHDLIHDLALSIAQGKYLILESDAKCILENAQHLYFEDFDSTTWSHIWSMKRVRSVALPKGSYTYCSFIEKCITKFKFLRVLELGTIFESLPSSIGSLKHLRYLNLGRNSWIKSLPSSICELQSLQTLILECCEGLKALPGDIVNMTSLRYLILAGCQGLKALPGGMRNMTNLRYLILKGCWDLEALPRDIENMTNLRYLWITIKQMSQLLQEVGIECLSNLQFLAISNSPQSAVEELKNGNQISIRSKLEVLHLQNLYLLALPQWVQSFGKSLRQLRIVHCDSLRTLPAWLPELSSLETLEIIDCYRLSSLPQGMENLTSLRKLKIDNCGALGARCCRIRGDEWHKIAHVPEVAIDTMTRRDVQWDLLINGSSKIFR